MKKLIGGIFVAVPGLIFFYLMFAVAYSILGWAGIAVLSTLVILIATFLVGLEMLNEEKK